jgi:hypothetical protein
MSLTLLSTDQSLLSSDEEKAVALLQLELDFRRFRFDIINAYYEGEMRISNLGVSIPPQLANLKTVVGWPRVVVDSIDERLDVEGFRYSDAPDADADLWGIWQANDLDLESQLAHLDALVYGRSFVTVGAPDDPDDPPLITVDSPKEMVVTIDPRTRKVTSAFREVRERLSVRWATLYLPGETVSLEMDGSAWQVTDRNTHGLGVVPVVPMVNRARTGDRHGRPEITPELISITDAACRTLLGMEVAREFFAAPQRWILGAPESSFMAPDGTAKTAWETYIGRVLALERDSEGNVPSVGQFSAGDPKSFTAIIDEYAKLVTSMTGLPPEYLGITTSNPASADAIRMNSDRLITKCRRKQRSFEGAWENVMRMALLIRDGSVQPEANSMETLWRNPEIPTPAATSDALFKQAQMGAVPAQSDVVLERLGYSALERLRIEADRDRDAGEQFLQEISQSLGAKAARVDKTLVADVTDAGDATAGAPSGG